MYLYSPYIYIYVYDIKILGSCRSLVFQVSNALFIAHNKGYRELAISGTRDVPRMKLTPNGGQRRGEELTKTQIASLLTALAATTAKVMVFERTSRGI